MARYEDAVPKPLKVVGSNYTDDAATKIATATKVQNYINAGKATPVTTPVTTTTTANTSAAAVSAAQQAKANYEAQMAAQKAAYLNSLKEQRDNQLAAWKTQQDNLLGSLAQMKDDQLAAWQSQKDAYTASQDKLKAEQDALIGKNYDTSSGQLGTARQDSLQDSYVAYMKGLKNMPQISAVSGNGGYAQSLATKQQLNYENNRRAVEADYMNRLAALQSERDAALLDASNTYNTNLSNYDLNYQDKVANYNQNYADRVFDYTNQYNDKVANYNQLYNEKLAEFNNTSAQQAASAYESYINALKNAGSASTPVTTTSNVTTGVKVGDKVMSTQEYINYLLSVGYSPAAAAELFEKKGLSY